MGSRTPPLLRHVVAQASGGPAGRAGRLLDIDVQGHRKLRRRLPNTVSIFLLPPSFAVLEERLRHRHKDSPEVIAERLAMSRREVAHWKEYDYLIVNDRLSTAAQALRNIVLASRLRRQCQDRRIKEIIGTFLEDRWSYPTTLTVNFATF